MGVGDGVGVAVGVGVDGVGVDEFAFACFSRDNNLNILLAEFYTFEITITIKFNKEN